MPLGKRGWHGGCVRRDVGQAGGCCCTSQNQQRSEGAAEKPAVVSASLTLHLGFCCWVGDAGAGCGGYGASRSRWLATTASRNGGSGPRPGLRHSGRRSTEHILPGKPLEGPWAGRMRLTRVRDLPKAALDFFCRHRQVTFGWKDTDFIPGTAIGVRPCRTPVVSGPLLQRC